MVYLTSKQNWKKLSWPQIYQDNSPQNKKTPCGNTQQLFWLIDLKTLLENKFQSPLFTRPPPQQRKQPLCGHAQPVCGLIDLKMLVENNFQPPMFLLRVPLDQHKQPLCGHAEPLEKYFLGHMFIKGPPPLPTNIDNQ